MRVLASAMLVIVGVIHLLPLSGVLGSTRLQALYGTPVNDPDLLILMRHRSVLFGLLGVFLLATAAYPLLQPAAFVAGAISVLSLLWIAKSVGGYNPQVARVVRADVVALVCLAVGATALMFQAPTPRPYRPLSSAPSVTDHRLPSRSWAM